MLKIFLFLVLSLDIVHAQTFDLGRFSIGESRIDLSLNDFVIHTENAKVKAAWVPSSVQWIRNESNLLVPRALLRLFIKSDEPTLYLHYAGKTIIPVKKRGFQSSDLYIDLFNPEVLTVMNGTAVLDKVSIEAKSVSRADSTQLIDYSCAPYELKVEGIGGEYLSIGCKLNRLGKMFKETPLLEITMSSTNLKMMNQARPPYTIFLSDTSPVEMKLKGADGKEKTMKLTAQLPSRLHRFKTSLGFGPYLYQSEEKAASQNANFAPSVMLYAKYDLNETASLRGFDALLYSKTFFNNSGLYFSYDLASALDGRIVLNTLLGFQGLHYKYSKETGTQFRLIYPQGFEVVYKHAFMENYNLIYGMFLSTSSETYVNSWLRYGKRNFLELNYIHWGHDRSDIRMFGISVGIPFISFL